MNVKIVKCDKQFRAYVTNAHKSQPIYSEYGFIFSDLKPGQSKDFYDININCLVSDAAISCPYIIKSMGEKRVKENVAKNIDVREVQFSLNPTKKAVEYIATTFGLAASVSTITSLLVRLSYNTSNIPGKDVVAQGSDEQLQNYSTCPDSKLPDIKQFAYDGSSGTNLEQQFVTYPDDQSGSAGQTDIGQFVTYQSGGQTDIGQSATYQSGGQTDIGQSATYQSDGFGQSATYCDQSGFLNGLGQFATYQSGGASFG